MALLHHSLACVPTGICAHVTSHYATRVNTQALQEVVSVLQRLSSDLPPATLVHRLRLLEEAIKYAHRTALACRF